MNRQRRDLATISPRFAKPALPSKRINLTARTLDRLFAAWRYGLLDETHLIKLLGIYGRQNHRELELSRAGLIYHPEAQIPLRSLCTNISWITALTTKGADILAAKGRRLDPSRHRERYRRHRNYNAILHDLNRTDFLVELDAAVRQASDRSSSNADNDRADKDGRSNDREESALGIRHQDELFGEPYTETQSFPSMVVWKREHKPVTIEPDGLFSLRIPNADDDRAEKFFALEIDQDTESNIRWRNFWDQKSILKTMIAYGEAHRRGVIQSKLGLPNLRTLFITTTERHLNNIIKDTAPHYLKAGYPPNAILFASRERLEKFDPLSVEYKNAAGRGVTLMEWD